MFSVSGKMAIFDLSNGNYVVKDIPKELYKDYLGGYGLGIALLMQEGIDPSVDALGPGNILGFASGYLTGTGAYIASRFMAFGKSPSTKGWGDANCGGYFGKKMKQAGFDVLLFKGIFCRAIFIKIMEFSIIKSRLLWGKIVMSCDPLKNKLGKIVK